MSSKQKYLDLQKYPRQTLNFKSLMNTSSGEEGIINSVINDVTTVEVRNNHNVLQDINGKFNKISHSQTKYGQRAKEFESPYTTAFQNPYIMRKNVPDDTYTKHAKAWFSEKDRYEYEKDRLANIPGINADNLITKTRLPIVPRRVVINPNTTALDVPFIGRTRVLATERIGPDEFRRRGENLMRSPPPGNGISPKSNARVLSPDRDGDIRMSGSSGSSRSGMKIDIFGTLGRNETIGVPYRDNNVEEIPFESDVMGSASRKGKGKIPIVRRQLPSPPTTKRGSISSGSGSTIKPKSKTQKRDSF
jgi:hypothetical protein